MKLIRILLGAIILFFDRLTSPKPPLRSPADQKKIDEATRGLALYQFNACPFCVKVRREFRRLGLNIELRDAQAEGPVRQELKSQGGQLQTPCLRIPGEGTDGKDRWLYESDDIIAYVRNRFSSPSGPSAAS